MNSFHSPLLDRLVSELARRQGPIFVALDGRSGSGKSTLAAAVAQHLSAAGVGTMTVIEGDHFYAGGSASRWDARSPAERVEHVIDWRRQRQVLEQIRETGEASWFPFDWENDDWDQDRVPRRDHPVRSPAASVVMLEGAYSARPELHDVLDLRVLLHVPKEVRRARLLERDGEEYRADWESRWSVAEDLYFGSIMPPERFGLVLDGGQERP